MAFRTRPSGPDHRGSVGRIAASSNVVRFFLGVEIEAGTAYAGEALMLGESKVKVDWVVGPRTAARATPSTSRSAPQREQLRAIALYLMPAHTHLVNLVKPVSPGVRRPLGTWRQQGWPDDGPALTRPRALQDHGARIRLVNRLPVPIMRFDAS